MTQHSIFVCNKTFELIIHDENETLSNVIREEGIYSYNDLYMFTQILRQGDTFIDVGANIGWHTTFGALIVGSTGNVHSFEPVQKNYDVLSNNIKLNNIPWAVPHKVAVSDSSRVQQIFCSSSNFGDHVLSQDTPSPQHTTTELVECLTFDEAARRFNIDISKIRLIKIDAQGSEPMILDGMKQLLQTVRPYIIAEYSPRHIKACGGSCFDIFSFLDRNNYYPYFVKETKDTTLSNEQRFEPLTIDDLYRFTHRVFASPGTMHIDLLMSPVQIIDPDVFI